VHAAEGRDVVRPEAAVQLVQSGGLLSAVQEVVGELE